MKVSSSLPPPPHKNCHHTPGGAERVLDDLLWPEVRYGGFFMELCWFCSRPFGIVWLAKQR